MGILKKISAVILLIALSVFNIYSQNGSVSEDSLIQENTVSSSMDESSIQLNPYAEQLDLQTPKQGSTIWLFLRMILILVIVIACIYGVFWLIKRSMKTPDNSSDPFLRDVSSVILEPGKSVHVVTLLNHAYVIGVSDSNISLIGQLSESEADKELVNAMNLYSDEHKNQQKPKSFADILAIFMPNGPKDDGGLFGDTQKGLMEMMKNQRDKLNKGE